MIILLRQLVFRDFWLKLFSLALAVLIWLTVSFAIHKEGASEKEGAAAIAQPLERTFFNLPIMVMSSAADVRDFKVTPSQVEVTVQADAKTLQNLKSTDLRVIVDLTGIEAAGEGRKQVEVSVSTPRGVSQVRVAPAQVQVVFPPKEPSST
jgi:YbbR domain-containing protein